jgi:hypothetical protein
LYNTYRTVSGNSSLSQSQSQFCSDYTSYKQSGVAGNVGASYELFSGSASYSQAQIEAVGQAMCSSSFNAASASAMLNSFASVVDPNVINAFNECVADSKMGLIYSLGPSSADPNTLTISAYYLEVGTFKPQHVDSISIAQDSNLKTLQNVTCSGDLYTKGNQTGGVTLDGNMLTMTCTRSGPAANSQGFLYMGQQVYVAPVRIAVNTNVGAIIADLPLVPVTKPKPPATLVPIGSIVAFGGDAEPTGWMKCDGRAVLRTDYPDLFSAIGIAHGAGDGVTNFNIPDYRGRFLRGVSTDLDGRDPDRATRTAAQNGGNVGPTVGSVEPDAVGPHRHWVANAAGIVMQSGSDEHTSNGGSSYPPTHYTDDRDGVPNNPTLRKETRPQNAGVNFLIRVR